MITSITVTASSRLEVLEASDAGISMVNIQGIGLTRIDLHGNGSLGNNNFIIGDFTYKRTKNSVKVDGDPSHPNGEYFYGYKMKYDETVDWQTWLPALTYLDLSGCTVRFFIEDSWGSGGGCERNFWVRFGSVVPDGMVAFHKKYKADGAGSQKSRGYLQFNGTTMSDHDIGTWGNVVGTTKITYSSGTLKGSGTMTISLPDSLVKFKIYDEWTNAYAHDFNVVIYPFGD